MFSLFDFGVLRTGKETRLEKLAWPLEMIESEGATGIESVCTIFSVQLRNPVVICLEDLRPFVGGFVENDPQKKLAIPKPRLPNGECPPGFLDYAVNMIHLDSNRLSFLTASGHGLRETLFYSLFSRLQIYKTRNEMMLALPCITDGALSLDGGMIRKCGILALGSRKDAEVKFPLIAGESDVPPDYTEAEDVVRKLQWETSKLAADIQREQQLLDFRKAKSTSQACSGETTC